MSSWEDEQTCANCSRDLSALKGSPVAMDWRLKLSAEEIPFPPGGCATMDVYMIPPIEKPLYFCGLGCVGAWDWVNYR